MHKDLKEKMKCHVERLLEECRLYGLDEDGIPFKTDDPLVCADAIGVEVAAPCWIGWMELSTYFLGIDHRYSEHEEHCAGCYECAAEPVLWESTIEHGDRPVLTIRYTKYSDAVTGHRKLTTWAVSHVEEIMEGRVTTGEVWRAMNDE